MADGEKVLVCAPFDAKRAVAGSEFGRACGTCGGLVMIAPSGTAFLARCPEARVECMECAAVAIEDGAVCRVELAAPAAEILLEMETAAPNAWAGGNGRPV